MVKDIIPWHYIFHPIRIYLQRGLHIFFTAWAGVFPSSAWKTDGTAAGTVVVKDVFTGLSGYASSSRFSVNGKACFRWKQ
jgi:ELWxxDGT repeat protein